MLGVEILSRSENIDNSVNLCLGYIMVSDFILFYFLIPSPERGRQKNISNEESSKEHH